MKIALLGDIALFGRCLTPGYFDEIGKYLAGFDYVVGNLETPFSVKKKTHGAKSAYICTDVENINILKQLHINAVTLANNHMFDYGKEGYETTKRVLKEADIEYFGTEGKTVLLQRDGSKVAFTGFCCYTSNPLQCVCYGEYGVNEYNLGKAKEIISTYGNEGYLTIMAVHAGLEHVNYPSIEHVRAARLLSQTCNFVYYGHHPHVIQGIEEHDGSLLAHSLGNFCFDDVYTDTSSIPLIELTENNRTGIILELTIENSKVIGWSEQPILITKEKGIMIAEGVKDIDNYNQDLESCEDAINEYIEKRRTILSERFSNRKSMRDIKWYLKRLRPRYLFIMLNSRNNKKKYYNCVIKYIEQK